MPTPRYCDEFFLLYKSAAWNSCTLPGGWDTQIRDCPLKSRFSCGITHKSYWKKEEVLGDSCVVLLVPENHSPRSAPASILWGLASETPARQPFSSGRHSVCQREGTAGIRLLTVCPCNAGSMNQKFCAARVVDEKWRVTGGLVQRAMAAGLSLACMLNNGDQRKILLLKQSDRMCGFKESTAPRELLPERSSHLKCSFTSGLGTEIIDCLARTLWSRSTRVPIACSSTKVNPVKHKCDERSSAFQEPFSMDNRDTCCLKNQPEIPCSGKQNHQEKKETQTKPNLFAYVESCWCFLVVNQKMFEDFSAKWSCGLCFVNIFEGASREKQQTKALSHKLLLKSFSHNLHHPQKLVELLCVQSQRSHSLTVYSPKNSASAQTTPSWHRVVTRFEETRTLSRATHNFSCEPSPKPWPPATLLCCYCVDPTTALDLGPHQPRSSAVFLHQQATVGNWVAVGMLVKHNLLCDFRCSTTTAAIALSFQ